MIYWNNTNQFLKVRHRLHSYFRISLKAFRSGINPIRLLQTRFPFYFPDLSKPTSFSVELTDACNLKCLYCNNHLFAHPRKFMNHNVFEHLLVFLADAKLERLRVGGGEPTLHPDLEHFSTQLAPRVKFLSIVSNGQWRKHTIASTLLKHYHLIEISVDSGGKEMYEKSRPGADYDRLIKNLETLNRIKKEIKSKALINIRLMIRPSNAAFKKEEIAMWKQYGDTVMPQFLVKHMESDYEDDIYISVHTKKNDTPRCTLPFKDLQVRLNGDVPLCQTLGSTVIQGKKKIIGNVTIHSLQELWNGPDLVKIRKAHRTGNLEELHLCRGCRGC